MDPWRATRRPIVTPSGRRFSLCRVPRSLGRPLRHAVRRRTVGLAWVSGATLVLVLLFSVYAAERPPTFAEPAYRPIPPGFAHATFADVLNAAGR